MSLLRIGRPVAAALALALLQPLGAAAPAAAQEAQASGETSAQAALYDAMQAGIDREAMFDNLLQQMAATFVSANPQLAALEQQNPGLAGALIGNLRPVLERYSDRVNAAYRPRMIAEIGAVYNDTEAAALAEFYNSPLGRRATQLATSNMSVASAGHSAATGAQVSEDDINQDIARTGMQAMAAMSMEERTELLTRAMATPGFAKMPQLMARIAPVRAEMENAPPNAAEIEAIAAAVSATIEQFAR